MVFGSCNKILLHNHILYSIDMVSGQCIRLFAILLNCGSIAQPYLIVVLHYIVNTETVETITIGNVIVHLYFNLQSQCIGTILHKEPWVLPCHES